VHTPTELCSTGRSVRSAGHFWVVLDGTRGGADGVNRRYSGISSALRFPAFKKSYMPPISTADPGLATIRWETTSTPVQG
jgi:hypothetical protein